MVLCGQIIPAGRAEKIIIGNALRRKSIILIALIKRSIGNVVNVGKFHLIVYVEIINERGGHERYTTSSKDIKIIILWTTNKPRRPNDY